MAKTSRQVALITGSGRQRVGNVVARYLAERGYDIALHYHSSQEDALATREQLREQEIRCEAYQADVRNGAEVDEMASRVHSDFRRLDVLVTTASVWAPVAMDEITTEDLTRNFEINTLGTFYAARAAGRLMVEQETGGAIVTFGDWAIQRPYADHLAYFISKGAIPTLTRALAVELAERNRNVRVNCIHPGPVMLPPDTSAEEASERANSTLLKRADCPETVADAVWFLVRNSFITGACIPIDGGSHMYAPEVE